jgi:hypothetical protein
MTVRTATETDHPTPGEHDAIERAVLDYFEGWYQADPDRMARALHPDLVKRSFLRQADGEQALGPIRTAEAMIDLTRDGGGRDIPEPHDIRITVDQIGNGIASASVTSRPYREFLHLARTPDGWRIVNAFWTWADGHDPRG